MAKVKEYKHNSHPQYLLHITRCFTKECRKKLSCLGPLIIFSSSKLAGNLQFEVTWLLPHSVIVSARGKRGTGIKKWTTKQGLLSII
jgi:hypothetical protein